MRKIYSHDIHLLIIVNRMKLLENQCRNNTFKRSHLTCRFYRLEPEQSNLQIEKKNLPHKTFSIRLPFLEKNTLDANNL